MRVCFARPLALRAGVAAVAFLFPSSGRASGQAPPVSPATGAPPLEFSVQGVPLDQARDGVKWESLVIGPAGRRLAYVTGKGAGLGWTMLQSVGVGKSGSVRILSVTAVPQAVRTASLPNRSRAGPDIRGAGLLQEGAWRTEDRFVDATKPACEARRPRPRRPRSRGSRTRSLAPGVLVHEGPASSPS